MPFAGGVTATGNGTLVLSALLAIAYLFMLEAPAGWRRTAVKTGSVLLLAVLAATAGGPLLLVVALVLCAAGDAFLAQEGERAFLAGLASFLAGHIAYLALFVTLADGADVVSPARAGIGVLLVAFTAAMAGILWRRVERSLRIPVTAYCATILVMGLAALGVPGIAVATGAILFMVSDAILAAEKFLMAPDTPLRRWSGPAVWVLYYIAQAAITLVGLL